jgi:hypothetical protein
VAQQALGVVTNDPSFTLSQVVRKRAANGATDLVTPADLVEAALQLLYDVQIRLSDRPDAWIRRLGRLWLHQGERLFDIKSKRAVQGQRCGVECVLDEANHLDPLLARAVNDGLHQRPPNSFALQLDLNGDWANPCHLVGTQQEIRADHGAVERGGDAIDVLALDEHCQDHTAYSGAGKVGREVMAVDDVLEGFVTDTPELRGVLGPGGD